MPDGATPKVFSFQVADPAHVIWVDSALVVSLRTDTTTPERVSLKNVRGDEQILAASYLPNGGVYFTKYSTTSRTAILNRAMPAVSSFSLTATFSL